MSEDVRPTGRLKLAFWVLACLVPEVAIIGTFAYFADKTFQTQLGVHLSWQVYAAIILATVAMTSSLDAGLLARATRKILPAVILVAVTGFGLFAMFVSWMTIGGGALGESVAWVSTPTQQLIDRSAVAAFQWLMLVGLFAGGLGFHQSAVRYLYGLDGFPAFTTETGASRER